MTVAITQTEHSAAGLRRAQPMSQMRQSRSDYRTCARVAWLGVVRSDSMLAEVGWGHVARTALQARRWIGQELIF